MCIRDRYLGALEPLPKGKKPPKPPCEPPCEPLLNIEPGDIPRIELRLLIVFPRKVTNLPTTPPTLVRIAPVSYTHLDVYKRQAQYIKHY